MEAADDGKINPGDLLLVTGLWFCTWVPLPYTDRCKWKPSSYLLSSCLLANRGSAVPGDSTVALLV